MIKNYLNSINPKNNLKIKSWDIHTFDDIKDIIEASGIAQASWKELKLEFKIELIKN